MIDKCDMCGSKIIDSKCGCGTWTSKEENENNLFKLSLEKFHKMETFTFSSDMPHLGCACIFFRGDYKDCEEIKKFIYQMKKRPFYWE